MKAIVKCALEPGNVEIRDIPEPKPGKGEVKVKVVAAGICGSDLHIEDSTIAIPIKPPCVMGHEFSGVISELGEGVTGWKVGDRVVSETAYAYCETCEACREGWYNLCPDRKTLGYWYNGVFANYTVVPARNLHKIPDSVDDISAALTEPLACVCNACFDLTSFKSTDIVLVSGPGPIGLMTLQVVKSFGPRVIVSGTNVDDKRLELAKKLGADWTINVQKEDLGELVNKLTGGKGVDVVMECSGSRFGTNAGLHVIKRRGYFTQIGMGPAEVPFYIEALNYRSPHVTGSLGSRKANWDQALQLLERKKVVVDDIASHKMPMEDWKKAFKMFANKEGGKFVLLPFKE